VTRSTLLWISNNSPVAALMTRVAATWLTMTERR
jgi:hypothetical protein